MNKNDTIQLEITDISAEGNGVGRYNDMAVFVPLTAPGDIIKAKVVKVKKNYAFAKLEEIYTPSPERTQLDCESFKQCGGCVFRHLEYGFEAQLKQNRVAQTMRRIGGVETPPEPIVCAKSEKRYRNKAQYPVAKDGSVGFYANRSHRIVTCDDCLLHPQEFTTVCNIFTNWVKAHSISVYDEQTHKGIIRHIYIRKGAKSGELLVCIVANAEELPFEETLINELKTAFAKRLKSVVLNINTKDTNVVLGGRCRTLYGRDYINDTICDVKVRISPFSFYQVNHEMAEVLYKKAAQYAQAQGKTVLDLYCGTGTIGLTMASEAKQIIGVEIVPQAVEDARENAAQNGFDNARFICGDAADAAQELKKEKIAVDTVILDPPRKGCEARLLHLVAKDFSPERIVYVSCDVATLARDTAVLTGLGYSLLQYTPVDLFPRTAHVETVALFVRTDSPI